MSPLAGPLASDTSPQKPRNGGSSGSSLPMQDLRPPGRRSGPPTQALPSARDHEILNLVARFRIMTAGQLRELFWPEGSPETRARLARRHLARLAAGELLEPLTRRVGGVRAGSSATTYAVGRTGQRLLPSTASRRVRRPHTPGERHLAHTLSVAQLYVDLVVAGRWGVTELLAFAPEPYCWRPFPGPLGARETLKPDAYAKLGAGQWEDSWFIECDLGSEAAVTIAAKARRYVDCYRTGAVQHEEGVFPRTAWITTDAARADVIREALGRLPQEARELFRIGERSMRRSRCLRVEVTRERGARSGLRRRQPPLADA